MAEIKELNTRLITRNDTEANWIEKNPILMPGEIAISISEKLEDGSYSMPKFKVGIADGTTEGIEAVRWADIPYCVDTTDLINKINNIKPTTENTFFSEDMTVTYAFGKYAPDASGSVTVPTKNKSVYDALLDAFAEAKNPTVDQPSVSISVSGGSGEVGTTFSYPEATLTIDDVGSYTYGSKDADNNKYGAAETGVVFAATDVVLKNGDGNTTTNESSMVKGSTLKLKANAGSTTYGDASVTFTFTATAKFTESDRVPVNNLGTKVDSLKITTGNATVESKTATFTGIRKCFYGYKSTDDALADPTKITSAQVRALGNIKDSLPSSLEVPVGTKQVYFLAKAGKYTKTLAITDANALNAPVACKKVASGVQVNGANDYAATAYDLWYVNLDGSFGKVGKLNLAWT